MELITDQETAPSTARSTGVHDVHSHGPVDRLVDRAVGGLCSGTLRTAFSLLLNSDLYTISSDELKNSIIKFLSPLSLQFSTSVKISQI